AHIGCPKLAIDPFERRIDDPGNAGAADDIDARWYTACLGYWYIRDRGDLSLKTARPYVFHHADDLHPARRSEAGPFPQRRLALEITPGKCFVDDNHLGAHRRIPVVELSTQDHRRAQRPEVILRNVVHLHMDVLIGS